MKKTKVFVIVEDGMIQSVYADKDIELEIVDLDSQNAEESDCANARLKTIRKKYLEIC